MDSGTSTHPPCSMCDPTLLPEGYAPIDRRAIMLRPDGKRVFLHGTAKTYLNGIDVTAQTVSADPERGAIVVYHRVMGTDHEGKRQMMRHFCNRSDLDQFDPALQEGETEAHACRTVLTGEVFVLDPATGEAPVFWQPEDVVSGV